MLEILKGLDLVNILIASAGAVGTFIIIYCTIYLVFVKPRKKETEESSVIEEKKATTNEAFKPNVKGYNKCELNEIMGYDFIQILSSENKDNDEPETSSDNAGQTGENAPDKPRSFASSTGVGMDEGINESRMGVTGKDKYNDDTEEPDQAAPVTHSAAPPKDNKTEIESLKDEYVSQPHMTDAISSDSNTEEPEEYEDTVEDNIVSEEDYAAFSRFGSSDDQYSWNSTYENSLDGMMSRASADNQNKENEGPEEEEDDGSGEPSDRRLDELSASFIITEENKEQFRKEELEYARMVDSESNESEKELLNSLNDNVQPEKETVRNVQYNKSNAQPEVTSFEFEIESER